MEIVLGVSGSIAAYKAAEIVRGFRRRGAGVTVVMTRNARRFITPLTLQTLSGRAVITSAFGETVQDRPDDIEHLGLARSCDALVVAPASAGTLARMAAGMADDFLGTFYLAVTCPVLLAPAMNTRMWEHPAVRRNVEILLERGASVIGPDTGELASASEGAGIGRMAEPEAIVQRVVHLAGARGMQLPAASDTQSAASGPLAGRTVLVTAGPTREELDPVRFLSNPSSGKMGYAVAAAARAMGARVVMVSGPTQLGDPEGVDVIRVTSAAQMRDEVISRVEDADVVVKTAAVSDFRPAARASVKVRKGAAPRTVKLVPTPDILAEIGRRKGSRFVVGFAAETDHLESHAREKLRRKKLDLIVANSVGGENGGAFGADDNEVTILEASGEMERWPRMSKPEVAARLMKLVASRLGRRSHGKRL